MDSVARRARVKLALPPSADARISVEFNLSSRQAFETLAARAGIAAVAFHSSFGDAAPFAFRVRDMDFIEAMDQLAFRTGTFWQPVGNKIIEVGTNTPVARLDVERVSMRTIVLTNIQTSEDTRDIVTLLTSLISPREISNGEGIITLTDTLDRIALAEAIVAQLDVPGRTPLGRSPQPTAPPQQRGATPIF
jgi:hypothetical protein